MILKDDTASKTAKLKAVQAQIQQVKEQPTWEQVWYGGFGTKKGIYQMTNTSSDKLKLDTVKQAVDRGEIGTHVPTLKKFSKSHALVLYDLLKEQRREHVIKEMVAHTPDNYILITEVDQLSTLCNDLLKEDIIGLDTETTGLDYDLNYIVGISITLPKADYHVYIPVRHENTHVSQLRADYVFHMLRPFLEDSRLQKVLHNAKFDMHMLDREGIYLQGLKMDTLIAMKILNENEFSFSLKNLATKYGKYFGFEDKSMTYEDLFGKGGFENTPLDIGLVYACKDTHLCYQFYLWIDEQLQKNPQLAHVYYDIELPNTVTAFDMERVGFELDRAYADEYTVSLRQRVEALESNLKLLLGDININSNDQLADVLYDQLGYTDKSKKRSVKAEDIKFLAMEHEELNILLEYRELHKLLTTYFEALPQKIWTRDGRLHGSFNQSGTKTGRYSSNNPNLQNIPSEARPMLIAPEGKVIIGKDLSQIEPRCLAYLSDDKHFQEPYLTGTDLYSTLASKTFKLPIEQCLDGSKYRKMMKTGLLAVMYGTSIWTLSKQLKISVEEATQFIQDFLNNYPQTRDYIQGIKDFVDKNGYVMTAEGRKRRFPEHKLVAIKYHSVCRQLQDICGCIPDNIWEEKWKSIIPYQVKQDYWKVAGIYSRVTRQAVNAVIQGSSADYIKQVMYRVNDFFKTLGDEYRLIATIHDEILMEVPDSISADIIAELDRIMTSIEWFKFPVKTDTVVMYQWGREIPVKQWLSDRDMYNTVRQA